MTKRMSLIFSIIFCACLFSLSANAQTNASDSSKSDPRVAKALKESNTDFKVSSKDGNYEVTYGTKSNRKQTCFITSSTEDFNGVEMRLVFSFAVFLDKLPSPQTANLLLEENMEIFSSWAILKVDKTYAIVNRIWIPADLSGDKLDKTLQEVVVLADEMENRLTKKDTH